MFGGFPGGGPGTNVMLPRGRDSGDLGVDDRSRPPRAAPPLHHGDRRHAHPADGHSVGAAHGRRHLPEHRHPGGLSSPGTIRASPPRTWSGASCWSASAPIPPRSTASTRIESQSIPGLGILKVYFKPGTDIGGAIAQINAQNNSILRIAPPGITPPNMIRFNASNVPVAQVTLNSKTLPEQQIFDYGLNFLRVTAVHHSGPVDPGALRRQAAADHRRRRSLAAARQGPVADGRGQRAADHQRHRAGRHRPHRRARVQRQAQLQPAVRRRSSSHLPVGVRDGTDGVARRRRQGQRQLRDPAERRAHQRPARQLHEHPEELRRLDHRGGEGGARPPAGDSGCRARGPRAQARLRPVGVRAGRRRQRRPRGGDRPRSWSR